MSSFQRTSNGLLTATFLLVLTASGSAQEVEQVEKSLVVEDTTISWSYPVVSSPQLLLPGTRVGSQTWGDSPDESTHLEFDKDILVNGNRLAAGRYQLRMSKLSDDDIQVAFFPSSNEARIDKTERQELLRLSLRPEPGEATDESNSLIHIDLLELPPDRSEHEEPGDDDEVGDEDKGEDEGEDQAEDEEEEDEEWEEEDETRYELSLHWGTALVTVRVELMNLLMRATPPPKMPKHVREAWAVVHRSLKALADQDLDRHISEFSDDFVSEFDDGGSAAAHVQLLGHVHYGGHLEGMLLHLENVEWTVHKDYVEFRSIVLYPPEGKMVFSYRVKKVGEQWKPFHLGVEE